MQRIGEQLLHLSADAPGQLLRAVRPLQRVLDAADDIRPIGGLGIPGADRAQQGTDFQIIEPEHYRGSAQIHRRTAARPPRLKPEILSGCIRQDHAPGLLRQLHGIAVLRNDLAGQPRHTVHRHAALPAPPPPAAGGREGIPRPPQGGEQVFPCLHRKQADFAVQDHTNA